jgi:hypothetical protein
LNPIIKDIWATRIALVIWCIAVAALVVILARAAIGQIQLDWDDSPSQDLASYKLKYGTNSRSYSLVSQYPKTVGIVTISNLPSGKWYFAVTAVASNGVESDFSNEVGWTNRPYVPMNLRLTPPMDALILQASVDGSTWKTLAVITSTNSQPLQLTSQPKQMFRVISTNLPPMPR